MDTKQLARELLFNGSIISDNLSSDVIKDVREYLAPFDLQLTNQQKYLLAYSFTPALQQQLPMSSLKFLKSVIQMAPNCAVLEAEIEEPLKVQLLRLKYGEIVKFGKNFPLQGNLIQKFKNKNTFIFNKRLFLETQTGIICQGCDDLGGFMVSCSCGKIYHLECAQIIEKCCDESSWDGITQILYDQ
ncbi:hypothetical protein SS50377_28255 [Spironucleus salmonicida]|uniref:Uncharacterized protein n=1 Tax=Spironucleus salmonicida TaxID=348837 RepID=V6M4Z8_9EUKA|nr:hypothetical protein SS50377_28255 [Spironucleus salmonicida]|eukprot:EST48434.1 Hypothetical protein SS50377_11384 [Spironucleus salmonicida]